MIEYEGIHHVSLVVKDLQRTEQFYREVLGLEKLDRPDFGFPGAWLGIGSQQLHLIVHDEAQTVRENKTIDSRDGHFAIRVKSFDETIEHLKNHGVKYKAKPDSTAGFAQIFCCDPDGNLVEFNTEIN
ncbi:MAG TPA: VOC family protein [Bacillales bacterium]|nr:VOC family protein [Bacillales bacterium]